MKIKTDNTHKEGTLKSSKNLDNARRIVQKVGPIIIVAGMVITMSGCNTMKRDNKEIMRLYKEENQAIMQMYDEGTLNEQDIDSLQIGYAPIDEDFINNLPQDLRELNLYGEQYITDLSNLPFTCPQLECLSITNCYGITNFNFIKDFQNIKEFKLYGETIGITEELISYLDSRGIKHNLGNNLVELDDSVERILNDIVTDDMSDDEKMDAITNYVINNMEYDKSALKDSSVASHYNEFTLSSALEGRGVCANYASLINALCSKANITSYVVGNYDHAWNLVKLEGKYYYIDATNICQIPFLSKLIMKHFGKGFFYKQDPYSTAFSSMSDIDSEEVIIPEKLLELIKESENQKSFIEKYGSNAYIDFMAAMGIAVGLFGVKELLKNKGRRY